MAAKHRHPPQVGALGSLIAERLRLTISCDVRGCDHSQTLDIEALEALARELGADYPMADFVARSRCSKCAAKLPQLSVKVRPIHTGGMRLTRKG